MTTPERLRRRQRVEGLALLLVGVLVALSTYVNAERDERQESCLTAQVVDLTAAIEARGDINAANTQATKDVILGVARATSTEDYADITRVLSAYVRTTTEIEQSRKDAKIPAFPDGKCD